MSNSVQWVPLSSVLETIVDNRGKTVPTSDSGLPLIATNCIKETSIYPTFENVRYVDEETLRTWFRAHLKPNDILFVNKGTPGRVCLVPDPVTFCAAQDMVGFRADPSKIDYRYLFAFLRSDWVKQTIANNHVGLVIPHFRKQDLDTLSVPLREMKDQQMIGGLYLLLSEKIELNQRMNEELEGMAKLLYDYWFVQYDFPMSAAQAAALGKPHLTGHPYRASGGPMTYSETLKREIPKGWEAKALCDLTEVSKDSVDPADEPERLFKLFSIPGFDQTGTYSLAAGNEIGSNKFVVTEKDLLVSKLNPWTSRVIYADADIEAVCSTEFVVWRTATEWQKAFLYMVARSPQFIAFCSQSATGTSNSHKRVNPTVMMSYAIPSSKEVAKAFGERVSPMLLAMQTNKLQNQELTTLRDWLLPMLMNGQVVVS